MLTIDVKKMPIIFWVVSWEGIFKSGLFLKTPFNSYLDNAVIKVPVKFSNSPRLNAELFQ